MGTGVGHGEHRAVDAAQKAIASPLLDNTSIEGAKGVLINFTGGSDLGLHEVEEAARIVQQAAHDEANIIFGAVVDPALQDELRVTVIATGFSEKKATARDRGAHRGLRGDRRGERRPRRPRVSPAPGGLTRRGLLPACRVRDVTTERGPLRSHGDPVTHFTFASFEKAGVPHLTTTRHCPGVTPSNLATGPFDDGARGVLASAGLDYGRLAWAKQVHGNAVARVGARGGPFADGADVLVTDVAGVALAIFTADCLAITLYDAEANALAVAHAGWRGTARDVPGVAVAALHELGARPERLRATIGPSIGPCCYEVDEAVTRTLDTAFPDRWERWVTPARAGHVMLDLWKANEELLERAGVDPERIDDSRLCTACHRDVLYSYRKGDRGRLVTVAALP
jgi:YfiH family protein